MDSFYSVQELGLIGFKFIGNNILLSRKASVYSAHTISIGDNVRIDDFCILSGKITIGSNVHISAYVALYGSRGIVINDFSGISARTTIYSAVDDFSGDYLIGPMCPTEATHIIGGEVILDKYVQIGASCVVMPNLSIEEGAVIGAMSFVNKSISRWTINAGIPCEKIKNRSRGLLKFIHQDEK